MMGDEQALLAAIIAHPDEDTPRLVYADWLQEHDQPERAEFIRVQIELWSLVIGDPANSTRYEAVTRRDRDFLLGHGRLWSQAFAAALPKNRQTDFLFRRGFVGSLICTPKYFKENAQRVVDAAPFERLMLRRPTARTLQESVSNPLFKRFRTVHFDADEITPQIVQPLLNSDLQYVRRLSVTSSLAYSNPPRDWATRNAELVEQIAGCGSLTGLNTLDLRQCGVGERGAVALATSAVFAGLRVLLLTGNGLGEAEQKQLRERFGPRVYFDYPEYRGRLTVGDLR